MPTATKTKPVQGKPPADIDADTNYQQSQTLAAELQDRLKAVRHERGELTESLRPPSEKQLTSARARLGKAQDRFSATIAKVRQCRAWTASPYLVGASAAHLKELARKELPGAEKQLPTVAKERDKLTAEVHRLEQKVDEESRVDASVRAALDGHPDPNTIREAIGRLGEQERILLAAAEEQKRRMAELRRLHGVRLQPATLGEYKTYADKVAKSFRSFREAIDAAHAFKTKAESDGCAELPTVYPPALLWLNVTSAWEEYEGNLKQTFSLEG